jgi:hypothetical protein
MTPDAQPSQILRSLVASAVCALAFLVFAVPALAAPTVTTNEATAVHHTSAVLNGHIDPAGDPGTTDCHFDWGTDTSYTGGTVPCAQGNNFDTSADVSATLGFLTPDTVYHYRVSATTTSSGILQGADQIVQPFAFSTIRNQLGAFGPDGTSGSNFANGQFGQLAIDPSTHRLYAFSYADPSGIYGFDASNPLNFPPVSGFTPLPLPDDTSQSGPGRAHFAVDSASGNLYVAPRPDGTKEEQKITVAATAGTFNLTFNGQTTVDLPFNATPDQIQNALNALSSVDPHTGGEDSRVFVGGGPGNASGSSPYRVEFRFTMGDVDQPEISCSDGATPLSGGTGCSVTTTVQGKPDQVSGFDSSGTPLGGNFPLQIAGNAYTFRWGIAVDSAGHLWVTKTLTSQLLEYSSAGVLLGSINVTDKVSDPGSIAFDSQDNLYVGGYSSASPTGVYRYSAASGYTSATKIYDDTVTGIAIDPSNDHVFITPRTSFDESGAPSPLQGSPLYEVREYDNRGNLISRFGRGITSGEFLGVAVDAANHYAYASYANFAAGGRKIAVFDPGTSQELPTITQAPASPVAGDSATLNAKVDPETHQVSDCHFDWGLTASYGQSAPCDQDPGSGSGDVRVSAGISGLDAGTTYHFRIVAANGSGTVTMGDQTFSTLGPVPSRPQVSEISNSSASFGGDVDPGGHESSCYFEFGFTTAYGSQAQCVPESQPATDEVQRITVKAGAGGFRVAFKGQQTADLPFNVPASGGLGPDGSLENALNALSSIGGEGGSVSVSGGPGDAGGTNPYLIQFGGSLGGRDVAALSTESGSPPLSGGIGETKVSVATASTPRLTVKASTADLEPNRLYHVRLVSTNSDATSHSGDVTFITYSQPQSFLPCANDTLRTGAGAGLPDCRAYEQATATDKNGSDIVGSRDTVDASSIGGGVTFNAVSSLPGSLGSQGLQTFMARRGESGWTTQGLFPPPSLADRVTMAGWTPDFSHVFTVSKSIDSGNPGWALIDRDTTSLSEAVIHPNLSSQGGVSTPIGVSADATKVFFTNVAQVTPDATLGVSNIYLWDRNTESISVAGQIPAGSDTECGGGGFGCLIPAAGTYAGLRANASTTVAGFTQQEHAVSSDGSQLIFNGGPNDQLYARLDAAGTDPATVRISSSAAGVFDPNGTKPAIFQYASLSGDKVFFTSSQKLTEDANTGPSSAGVDLYLWDRETRTVADLTSDPGDPDGAEVIGVLGGSDDGSYLYLLANADFDGAGGPASRGDCHKTDPDFLSYSGRCNIYLWHAGDAQLSFIAPLGPGGAVVDDSFNVALTKLHTTSTNANSYEKSSRVAADGRTLLFSSSLKLTSYENAKKRQLYRWQVGDAAPTCITCNPTGAPPSADISLVSINPPGIGWGNLGQIQLRNLSADGNRIFFESWDKLVGGDTNGTLDVYEWEAPGSGSCTLQASSYIAASGGCLYLIGAGSGADGSQFAGASESGDDVFFFTREALVPQDNDELVDVYDARVQGGLAAQHAVSPPDCDVNAGACESAATSSGTQPGAATAAIQGLGDPPPARCPHGKVRRSGRCVAAHHRKHKHRKQPRRDSNHGRTGR